MALKSMKTTKADLKARQKTYAKPMSDGEDYPYGLRITLDADALKKLGVTSLPKTGAYVTVQAECCVKSTSIDDRNGRTERRIELQIENMEVTLPKQSAEDAISDAVSKAGEGY